MKRITIYDVAKEADVSLATVSRVINHSSVVREDTKKRVEEAIERLGFKPNAVAQGLALQKTTTIALVVSETSLSYTGYMINGLMDVAKIYGYNIILHTTTEGITEMDELIENIIKSRVDGAVIFNDKLTENELQTMSNYQLPLVIVGNRISRDKVCSVFVDLSKASYELAVGYLKKGIKDIVLIEDRKNQSQTQQLCSGLNKAFEEFGVSANPLLRIPRENRTTYSYLKNYLKEHKHQVMIANRDSHALAILNAAKEAGIAIPEDVEIVCIYDSKYNSMIRPTISSFNIPAYDLGAVAMRVMTKLLNEDDVVDKEIELNYVYNPRSSTK